MNRPIRVLLYGVLAIALVACVQLFRAATPVAEARCNNQPNHACTLSNDNVNSSGGGVTEDGRHCNFQPNHACTINDNNPVAGDESVNSANADNHNDNNGQNDNFDNTNRNFDNTNDNVNTGRTDNPAGTNPDGSLAS